MRYLLKSYLLLVILLTYNILHAQDTIKIGIDHNYPPYEFLNDKGEPSGFNVDLIKSILTDYSKPYLIIAKPWDETYNMFKEGKIDVISTLFSAERNKLYNLSVPHNLVSYSAFYNKNNPNDIKTIDYNEGVIVIKDDIINEVLKLQMNESNITTADNAEEAIKIINESKTKIALLPKLQGLFLINKNHYDNIKLSENILYTEKYCFAVNRNNQKLIYYLNEGLSIAKVNNVYDKLYQKWFSPLEPHKSSFTKLIKEYLVVFLIICLILFIIILWNLTLKRAINKRNKELKEELSAHERSEMAIIESEERFRTLTDNSPAAIFIFNLKKIFFVNNAASEITNYTKEELLKMSFLDILNGEKDKKLVLNLFDKSKRNKIDNTRFDVQIKEKKGNINWNNISAVKSFYRAEPVIIVTAFDITDRHDFEAEILESKRMYSTLLDNLPGMVYQCNNDENWTMTFASDGCLKLTGYNPEEIINNSKLSFNDIIYPEDRKYVWEFIQKKINQNRLFTLEYRIITKSNEIKWVWEQGKLFQSAERIMLEGYIVDITERVNTKKELIEERLQYETMLQSIGDGVISTDIEGRITVLNKTAEKLTGWKQEDAIGKPLEEVFNIINELTRESISNPVKKVLDTGFIIGLANHTVLVSKNGNEYIISDSAAPIRDENDVITGVILVFSDNTANRKAEDAIKESEAKLKATFDAIPDLIFRNNAEGYFTDFHAGNEQMLLIEPSKIIGSHISDLFDEKLSKKIIKTFSICLNTGEPQNIDYYINTPTGKLYYNAKIVKYNNTETLALCRDITLRKNNEEVISRNYKLQKLISDISFLLNSAFSKDVIFNETLEITGKNLNVSRAYIFENYNDNKCCSNTYEWCNENISKQIGNLQNIDYNLSLKFKEELLNDSIVISPSIAKDFDGRFLQMLQSHDIKSMICLPLYVRNVFFGFIGFDNCFNERVWDISEIELMKTLSVLISNVFERDISTNIIKQEREQLETTLYSIGDAVIVTDVEGKIKLINKVAEQLTGFSKEEALEKSISQILNIVHIDSKIPLPSLTEKVIETGEIVIYENKALLIAKNGKDYIISENASPIKDNNGNISGVVVVFKDNTDKKRADDAIKKSEYNYRKLFDSANDVIFILKESQIVNCNQKTLEMFGYSKEEIIGKTPYFVSPAYQSDGAPSNEKAEYYINLAYTGVPLHFEWDHQNKNGSIINCEISLNKLELENEKFLQAIVRDITQRKVFERALSESEDKYKTLVEKANDGIAIIQDNNFIFINNKLSEMTSYKPEEVINKPFLDFMHPDCHELIINYYKARMLKAENVPSIYEVIGIHKTGYNIQVELNSNFFIYNGKPAILVIVRDVSERKIVEDNLRLFKATVENSTDAIGIATPEGIHTYQNAAFDRLFGTLEGDKIATRYKEEEVKNEVFKTIMSGGQFTGEIEMISKEGKLLNIFLRAYPIFDSFGKITGLVGIHTNITEKKQIEDALQKSEEKFRMLLELAADGFFQGDENGNIITVNNEAVKITGYSKEELLRLNLKDLFSKESLDKNPLQYSTLDIGVILKNEREVKCKDGILLSIEMVSRKMPDNTYQSFFRDITERDKAEKALIESEKKYRVIVDYTPDAIIVHTSGKIVFANAAALRMVGAQSVDQIINKNTLDFVHPDYKEVVIERIKKMYETKEPQNLMEEKFIRLNNEAFDVEVVAIPIIYMGKQAIQTIIRDITDRKESEKALIESEEKYRQIVNYSPDAIIIHIMGKIVFANAAAFKLIGAEKPGQIIDRNAIEFVHPDDREIALQRIKKIFETNQPQNFVEEKFVKLNNEIVEVEVVGIPIIYMGKQAVQTIIRDITDRKQSQKALIESEEKYRLLFENITQGFALHEIILDDKGKPVDYIYISVNPAFGQLTGLDIKDIAGKHVRELIPDTEPYWIEKYGEVALTGKSIHYENYTAGLEKYYDAWAFSPRKGQFAVVFSDITERKHAEDTLKVLLAINQMSEKPLQEITDYTLQQCVNLTKSEIAFLAFVNEEETNMKLHSFSKEILEGADFDNVPLDFDLTKESLFSNAIITKKPVIVNDYNSYKIKKKLPPWHLKIERILIVPIEEDGKVVTLVAVANKKNNYHEIDTHQLTLIVGRLWKTIQTKKDNESIKKLNLELIEKNKEMEQFVYVTSHDLRSPLVNIQGFTKELVDNCRTIKDLFNKEIEYPVLKQKVFALYNEDIDESLKYIELSARKMDSLLNGLLKLSRMGRIVVNIRSVDMNTLINEIISSLEFQIMKKNIEVIIEELHDCKADEVLINQVFTNLIDNAIKYCDKEKGYIKISSTQNNNKIIYCVEDNGPGIPEKYHQKIFEIFQRLSSSVSGEGLGLSIVIKIIEKHNGRIWLESELKKGTKFFIELTR